MSGFVSVIRSTFKMTVSEHDILQTLLKLLDCIAAAVWVVVCDAHAAEDIFQNVALKALKKEVSQCNVTRTKNFREKVFLLTFLCENHKIV